MDAIKEYFRIADKLEHEEITLQEYEEQCQMLRDVKKVVHGEWTEEGYCPFCKCDMPAFIEDWEWKRCRTPYCPNCGASMEKGEEDEIQGKKELG